MKVVMMMRRSMRALLLWIIEFCWFFLHTWTKISMAEVHSR